MNYSLHKISKANEFSFSPSDYSRFKFGDDMVAEKFGIALAQGFIRSQILTTALHQQVVVIPSPYAFIPTATFSMKNYFVNELNQWLADQGLPVVQETKIYRTITYKEDYGELDADKRMKLIGNDHFHIDKSFLQNKTLIFLDDIRITGSHERMIKRMLQEYQLENEIYLLYFAELVNTSIHPNIENYLNYYQIKSIFDLDEIIKQERFAINTRIVKYLLNSEPDSFRIFIEKQHDTFKNLLYNMALGNSYHTIDAYLVNLSFLKLQIHLMKENPKHIKDLQLKI
jgi:hypothetical protein